MSTSALGKDAVYSSLRQELTQTLFAFRQLLIGELAGYAALIGGMFAIGGAEQVHAYTLPGVVLLQVLIAFLIVTTTIIGNTWCGVAFRIGSYILVAMEIPALLGAGVEPKDRASLWILANRSEALRRGRRRGRNVIPGTDLHSFVVRQIGLFLTATAIMVVIVGTRWAEKPELQQPVVIWPSVLVAAITFVLTLKLLYDELQSSRGALGSHVTSWLDYLRNRVKNDAELLKSYGIDLNDREAMAAIYGTAQPEAGA